MLFLSDLVKVDEMNGACNIHWGRREKHTKFQLENLKGKDDSGDLRVAGRIILKWILGKSDLGVWFGFIYLRRESTGRLLWTPE
jgi:uncharacterized protein (DUF2235 family)